MTVFSNVKLKVCDTKCYTRKLWSGICHGKRVEANAIQNADPERSADNGEIGSRGCGKISRAADQRQYRKRTHRQNKTWAPERGGGSIERGKQDGGYDRG